MKANGELATVMKVQQTRSEDDWSWSTRGTGFYLYQRRPAAHRQYKFSVLWTLVDWVASGTGPCINGRNLAHDFGVKCSPCMCALLEWKGGLCMYHAWKGEPCMCHARKGEPCMLHAWNGRPVHVPCMYHAWYMHPCMKYVETCMFHV